MVKIIVCKVRIISLLIAMTLMSAVSYAQNTQSVNLSAGLLYPNTVDATLSYELETKYHNAWEFFINGSAKWKDCPSCGHVCAESFWKDHPTWGVGAAYKPCVYRLRNSYGRVRVGASAGSNTDKFLGGIHIGYEHNYSLRKGWRIFWQVKGDCMIGNPDLLRVGAAIGVAIPCNKRYKL